MRKSFLILTLALSFLLPAYAYGSEFPPNCMDRDIFIANLTKDGFSLEGRGLQKPGKIIELYTRDSGSFVILILHPNVPPKQPAIIACQVGGGEMWFGYKPNLDKYKKS